MNDWLAPGIAASYVGLVVGAHRFHVWRMRRLAQGFPVLRWLDWNVLLEGLVPAAAPDEPVCPPVPWALPQNAPGPDCLQKVPVHAHALRDAWVVLIQWPTAPGAQRAMETVHQGVNTEDARRWVELLGLAQRQPLKALYQLGRPRDLREHYLRHYLQLTCDVSTTNLEWAVFWAKSGLKKALRRWPESAPLHFVRALASSCLGQNTAVLDDLGRAVYFSRQSSFYVEAVRQTPYVTQARPALAKQCGASLLR